MNKKEMAIVGKLRVIRNGKEVMANVMQDKKGGRRYYIDSKGNKRAVSMAQSKKLMKKGSKGSKKGSKSSKKGSKKGSMKLKKLGMKSYAKKM